MGWVELRARVRGSWDNRVHADSNIAGGKVPQGQAEICEVLEIKRPAKISGLENISATLYHKFN